MGEAALASARGGRPVFPCVPGEKRPATAHGFLDATTDERQIREWWRRGPTANVAIPTGSLTVDVLDLDVRADGDGWAAFERLKQAGLLVGAQAAVRTRSGGLHLYFVPSGQRCGSIPDLHLDLKATGGYVLVPPSRVAPGAYELIGHWPAQTGTLDWSAALQLLRPCQRASRTPLMLVDAVGTVERLVNWLRGVTPGNRNAALFWACCRAVEHGVGSLIGLSPLLDVAVDLGLSERETTATARSALRSAGGAA